MKRMVLTTLLGLAVAAGLHGGHYGSLYVIPAAAHTNGINGTMWVSDVAIHNFNDAPIDIEMLFIESGFNLDNLYAIDAGPDGFATIPAGGTRILKDVVDDVGGMDQTLGAIIIGSTGGEAFAVTSRAYSMDPVGNTIGQTVLAARDFIDSALGTTPSPAVGYIPGLIAGSRQRTNLGFVAGASDLSEGPLLVEFALMGANGELLGTRQFSIPRGGFQHMQFPSTTITAASFEEASARVTILAGDGEVVPYASVIDNVTADAVFVLGELPPNMTMTSAAKRGAVSVFEKALRARR